MGTEQPWLSWGGFAHAEQSIRPLSLRFCRALAAGVGALLVLAIALPARATFIVAGNMADQTTFLGLVNADTQGGAWSLNGTNQLVFTANGAALNVYATQLSNLNSANNTRTASVMQNFPGVLVGAFGPKFMPAKPAGTQLIDLGDIQAFTTNGAAQPQPLLDTRGSVLLHELAELNADGGANAFPASHATGITMENTIMASQGIMGMRLPDNMGFMFNATPAAPGTNFATYRMIVPFQTTAAVPAGGGNPALANGAKYNEIISGRISGAANPLDYSITNIASGLIDTGITYDGTGFDVSITSITEQIVVPEPSTLVVISTGCIVLLFRAVGRRRRHGACLPSVAAGARA